MPNQASFPHPVFWARRILLGLFVIAVVFAAAIAGIGWYVSSEIEKTGLRAPAAVALQTPLRADATVLSIDAGRVTLEDGASPSDAALRDSIFGARWDRGYGRLGPVIERSERDAKRGFQLLEGSIAPGDVVEIDKKTFPDDPLKGLRLPFEEVAVSSELGDCPAWFIIGPNGTLATWAVFVHGKGGGRREALRTLREIADLGLPSLVLSYRNDPEAPPSPDGRFHYGLTEWRDVEAGVRYAIAHGAERVLLFGYSMGGGIAIQFLAQSPLASHVSGLVLDAPMLDFGETVDLGIRLKRLPVVGWPVPEVAGRAGKWIAARRFGIDWSSLAMIGTAERTRVPMLLFHGDADDVVPIETSRRLAAVDRQTVRLVVVPGAGHVESWNAEPLRYRAEVRAFVSRLLAAP